MTAILLTIHTMIVLALVGVVLLQRSEGGALGMGGGGGGLMSGRGAATALTRTTTILGAAFLTSSLVLALVADRGEVDTEFLPGQAGEEGGLEGDDFSDIVGTGEEPASESGDEPAPDAFTLPENLGIEADEPTGDDDEDPADEPPQR